jgi:hypothetical protein
VRLYWALPDALTRMVKDDDGATTIPAVPNRWLVTRSNNGKVEDEWVIGSDLLSEDNAAAVGYPVSGTGRPYLGLGRKTPLNVWNPQTTKSAAHLPKLTAVGYSEPTFAALYANCHSVFGFHDPKYQEVPPDGVGYDVVGWYDDVSQDPIAALRMARNHGVPPWQDVCSARFGWSVTEQGATSPLDRLACFARLTFGATAQANATDAAPRPASAWGTPRRRHLPHTWGRCWTARRSTR